MIVVLISVGYFSITYKIIKIENITFKGKNKKDFKKFIVIDESENKYMGMPLIAQIGKNYNNEADKEIDGDVLLRFALNKIKTVQNIIGGFFVYLECEDVKYLKDFYERNGFELFGVREVEDNKILLQMAKNMKNFELDDYT